MARSQMLNWKNSLNYSSETIDQHELTSHTEYLINGYVSTVGQLRFGSDAKNQLSFDTNGGPNYTIGVPRAWTSGNWSGGLQYTWLSYNPWVAFGGSWGSVKNSSNFDATLRYTKDGFTAVVGATYTSTEITPGLITRVNDIVGVWGEVGYKYKDFGVYVGVKPIPVVGSVEATLPTSVDIKGNIHYTNRTLGLTQQPTEYIRALWSTDLNKNTKYRVSGTALSNGQYRVMNEIKVTF